LGAIVVLFMPNAHILEELGLPADFDLSGIAADPDAVYEKTIEIDISGLSTMIARPGHPDDGVPIETVKGTKIDSGFIGSCTNGKIEDMRATASILKDRKLAPGIVLKIVPATRKVWDMCEDEGIIDIFMRAGVLVGNAGCAGCAAGQIGQNGPGEVTVSTGNRNFPGKQGKGEVYLASPSTVAASCIAGVITSEDSIPDYPVEFDAPEKPVPGSETDDGRSCVSCKDAPKTEFEGRVWVLDAHNVDTDMIFHNSHLQITDMKEMGQHAFGNLDGWEDFPKKVQPGDMLIVGENFGCGSSRQQAVDCFRSLGVSVIIGKSFGAIYERNAINAGFPIFSAPTMDIAASFKTGDMVSVDLKDGKVRNITQEINVTTRGFSSVQLSIYTRGGLLCADCHDW
jgi:3-isopropylmalate/(R)-2-methylmalate dehydratase large subunit